MDGNRRFLVIQFILVAHLLLSPVEGSAGILQNLRSGPEFADPSFKLRTHHSGDLESVNGVIMSGNVRALRRSPGRRFRGFKGKPRLRGVTRQGTNPGWEEVEEANAVEGMLDCDNQVESAVAVAQRAFQSYLERSDYFGSHGVQSFPPIKGSSLRGHLEFPNLAPELGATRQSIAALIARRGFPYLGSAGAVQTQEWPRILYVVIKDIHK
ncbi:hypothetical protein R1sor_012471 [Riccia sorocarpa]|uniref:Uncharacterized protein n=1 Tax=Riccia sorocarpa TaxID=122646 RepID=A0ABD3I7I0_9MARC